ncbi:MAG: TetR/AcrR family transcriptional regulator [Microbacterium sp.]|uniref:TetR/AcrR family transcriptional regulator n=1 Tax=Microbacterium sp. TaxID=51671 RepID=UPI002601B8CA|nr:TetR/AcrR family transcriptional regulator [Microbacterium sp.]MCX6501697.1 TetR/AcrR family transcriptional regulator [Microbacterium sp.]
MTDADSPEAQRLLDAAVSVILERGVVSLSLSQLAKAIGSNNRMLLYYFGSKDELFTRATLEAYGRFPGLAALIPSLSGPGSMPAVLSAGWRVLRAEEHHEYHRLFFEVLALAMRAPEENRAQLGVLATHWPDGIRAAFRAHGWAPDAAARATLQLLALWRGLQTELLTSGEPSALDAAHDAAVEALFAAPTAAVDPS